MEVALEFEGDNLENLRNRAEAPDIRLLLGLESGVCGLAAEFEFEDEGEEEERLEGEEVMMMPKMKWSSG